MSPNFGRGHNGIILCAQHLRTARAKSNPGSVDSAWNTRKIQLKVQTPSLGVQGRRRVGGGNPPPQEENTRESEREHCTGGHDTDPQACWLSVKGNSPNEKTVGCEAVDGYGRQ